jgi:carbon starvation protein
MHVLTLLIAGIVLLLSGYFIYGSFLSRIFRLDKNNKTPAVEFRDDEDFVPTNKFYLLGQHLSAIAAAGPIVGPILAGMWFGWLPTMLWIIFGGIFIGGVHDMVSLVASLRHQGRSIAEIIRENMSKKAFILFLLFLWFSLIYIITAFTDITASTFVDKGVGPQVASSSMMYLGLAFLMGVTLKNIKMPLSVTTLIFLPFVFVCIYLGRYFPLTISPLFGLSVHGTWNLILLIYCFFAAVIPVWLLLQPRGYLGGFFLVATAGASFIGIIVGSFTEHFLVQYPAFTQWVNPQGFPLFPLLFTTVACGACSGFHTLVSSGTTSKQISREPDARLVGYGGMLMESFVALVALATLLILSPRNMQGLKDPNQIFAQGVSVFLHSVGVNKEFALNFALLAFATFVYDTLDVATRLGRYIFQELIGWRGRLSSCVATLATLIFPGFFLTREITDPQGNSIPAWKTFWTVFGSSNQLLAAIVLLGLSVWMFRSRMRFLLVFLPAVFMIIVAVFSLFFILKPWALAIFFQGKILADPMAITGVVLLILAILLIVEAASVFAKGRQNN